MGLSMGHVQIYMQFAYNLYPEHNFIISPWEHSDVSLLLFFPKMAASGFCSCLCLPAPVPFPPRRRSHRPGDWEESQPLSSGCGSSLGEPRGLGQPQHHCPDPRCSPVATLHL